MDARLALGLAAMFGAATGGPVAAQDEAPLIFAGWRVICERTVGAAVDDCAATQSAVAQDDPDVALTAYFVREPSGEIATLRIVAPLGVLLPAGLGLSVDGVEVGVAGFVRCLPPGCISEVALTDTLRGELENGKTATFSVSLPPARQANVALPLDGLAQALTALRTATLDDGAAPQ